MTAPTQTVPPPRFDETGDATRRTWLANERTYLAWVRTGLTSTAVAVGIGKLVPELTNTSPRWSWAALGAGYALLGVALAMYGFVRLDQVDAAIQTGRYVRPHRRTIAAFAMAICVLGIGSTLVVVFA